MHSGIYFLRGTYVLMLKNQVRESAQPLKTKDHTSIRKSHFYRRVFSSNSGVNVALGMTFRLSFDDNDFFVCFISPLL